MGTLTIVSARRSLLMLALVASAACFDPHYANPGFYCMPNAHPACPDGQTCVDGRCINHAPSSGDLGSGGDLGSSGVALSIDGTTAFPATPIGKTSIYHFTVHNHGEDDALATDGASFQVTLTNSGAPFAITKNTCGAGLAAHASCLVDVVFNPSAPGVAPSTTLKALYTGPVTSLASVTLTGTGMTAVMLVWAQPAVTSPFDFGSVALNATPPTQTFRILNVGQEPASALAVKLTGSAGFSIVASSSNCAGATLGYGNTCDIVVAMATDMSTLAQPGAHLLVSTTTSLTVLSADVVGSVSTCPDLDGDGFGAGAGCTGTPDCDDTDADNWLGCATCRDNDGDGFYVGCDRYGSNTTTVHLPDCNDADATFAEEPRSIAADTDCSGAGAPSDGNAVFVSPLGGARPSSDTYPGTQLQPVATIHQALALVSGNRRTIVLATGTYNDSIALAPTQAQAITFMGGWDAAPTIWQPPGGDSSTIVGSDGQPTVYLNGPAVATGQSHRLLVGMDHVHLGGGSLAVYGSNFQLRLRATTLSALGTGGAVVGSVNSDVKLTDSLVIGSAALDGSTVSGISQSGGRLELVSSTVDAEASGKPGLAMGLSLTAGAIADLRGGSIIDPGMATNQTYGVYSESSEVTIRERTRVQGGTSQATIAVLANGSKVTVMDSILLATSNGTPAMSCGLMFSDNSEGSRTLAAWGSLIDGGQGDGSRAVRVGTVGPVMLANNLIRAGNGTGYGYTFNLMGIEILDAAGGVWLINNILTATGFAADEIAINVGATGTVNLVNNAFESAGNGGCTIRDSVACRDASAVTAALFSNAGTVSGNLFSAGCAPDTNGHITAASPCRGGGVDPTSYGLPPEQLDLDLESRPAGLWDIGPDEIN